MSKAFADLLLQRLAAAKEVRVETRSDDGKEHVVPIWIVVVGGAPYVRSVRGPAGRWYRELLGRGEGGIRVGARRLAVRPVRVRDREVIDDVSAALWRKYPHSASLFSMLRLAVLHTTLRLEPS